MQLKLLSMLLRSFMPLKSRYSRLCLVLGVGSRVRTEPEFVGLFYPAEFLSFGKETPKRSYDGKVL